jgi:hypothetical protein
VDADHVVLVRFQGVRDFLLKGLDSHRARIGAGIGKVKRKINILK